MINTTYLIWNLYKYLQFLFNELNDLLRNLAEW
jgi:hypothetical protein